MRLAATIVTAAVAFAVLPARGADYAAQFAGIDAAVAAAGPGFGGVILIEDHGTPVFRKAYGYSDREHKILFGFDTVAQIGSITKSMTALAVVRLAQEGKLDLQQPVKTYLPNAAEPAASATLHQLLTHHSGLDDYCADDFDRVPKADLLHRCAAKPLAHTPGTDNYSNMGYSILAAIVEQVSGEDWEAYLRKHIWQPLGMARTGFAHFDGVPRDAFAIGYLRQPQGIISDKIAVLGGDDWALKGNGGIQASANDMERYWRGLTGRLPGVPDGVFAEMTKPRERIDEQAWEGYGFAVRLDADGKPFRIGFAGSDGTFMAYFGWLPKDDIFMYVVGNCGEDNVRPVIQAVVHAMQGNAGGTPH